MLAVEPAGLLGCDEELGAVGVGTSVGHREDTGASVGAREVLISELLAVDGLSTGAVSTSEITTLKHELRDDTVERGALVAEALLTGAQSAEVLSGLGNIHLEEVEDATLRLGSRAARIGVLNVEEKS